MSSPSIEEPIILLSDRIINVFIMKDIPKLLLIAIGLPHVILSSGCPQPKDVGPRTDDDHSLCAIMYADAADDSNTSCTGGELQVKNGEEARSIASGWNDRVSSLVVRDGCTLTAYGDGELEGYRQNFHGIHFYLKHEHDIVGRKYEPFFDWNDKISSYVCNCWYKPVDCDPKDRWQQLISCDNTSGDDEMTCTYTESHGINIGKGFSNGHSISECISVNVAAEIGMEFAKASVGGSASLTTTYNWSESEEFSISETEGSEVQIKVPVGSHIGIYQIQGECEDSTTKTICYQSRDENTKRVLSATCPE